MNLRSLPLTVTLGLASFLFMMALMWQPAYIPPLHYFAPFFICVIYCASKNQALWLALACGIILDLFSHHTPFGFYAIANVVGIWIFYRIKQHFFADHLTTLPILTALYSALVTILEVSLLFLLDQRFHLTWSWMLFDLLLLSIADALYAGIGFTLPLWSWLKLKRWIRYQQA